ncbi:MAG TPA: sigma-70 family RNA polymerase sigma factor [Pirellulales bacterium]
MSENRSWLRRLAGRALGLKMSRWYDASDVAQECLQVAGRDLDKFQGQNLATFRAWLRGIQRNLVRKLWRTQLPRLQREGALPCDSQGGVLVEESATPVVEQVERREQLPWLKVAISCLLDDDRQLIEWKYLRNDAQEARYDELADQLATNAAQLRQRIYRLLGRLEEGIPLLQRLKRQDVAPHYQQILCWQHFRAWSAARIAQELGCTEKATKTMLANARKQLQSPKPT